jgi:hypothetical protein
MVCKQNIAMKHQNTTLPEAAQIETFVRSCCAMKKILLLWRKKR